MDVTKIIEVAIVVFERVGIIKYSNKNYFFGLHSCLGIVCEIKVVFCFSIDVN